MKTTPNDTIKVEIHAHHCEVEPQLRERIEEKLYGLERLWPKIDDAHVRFTHERGRYVAEITLISGGMITRSEELADNARLAFDNAVDKLERQLRNYKKKSLARERRHDNRDDAAGAVLHPTVSPNGTPLGGGVDSAARAETASGGVTDESDETAADEQVVRVKRFALKPMSTEEAALQMDLLGHTFFVYRDAESNQVSVVYRRHDGGYGLIEPVAD